MATPSAAARWITWGIPAAIFFIAFLHRVAPGTVARDIMQAFDATGAIVGLLDEHDISAVALDQPAPTTTAA